MLIVAKVILHLSGCKIEKIHEIMGAWAKPEEMSRHLEIPFSTGPLTADLDTTQLSHSTLFFVSTGKLIIIKMFTLCKSDQNVLTLAF